MTLFSIYLIQRGGIGRLGLGCGHLGDTSGDDDRHITLITALTVLHGLGVVPILTLALLPAQTADGVRFPIVAVDVGRNLLSADAELAKALGEVLLPHHREGRQKIGQTLEGTTSETVEDGVIVNLTVVVLWVAEVLELEVNAKDERLALGVRDAQPHTLGVDVLHILRMGDNALGCEQSLVRLHLVGGEGVERRRCDHMGRLEEPAEGGLFLLIHQNHLGESIVPIHLPLGDGCRSGYVEVHLGLGEKRQKE